MSGVFEDAFMDAQANSVSLCLEFLDIAQADVDMVYIFFYICEGSYYFKPFFRKGIHIIYPEMLSDREGVMELLRYGADDARNIQRVCKSYNKKCPYEMKLVFDTRTHKFDAQYSHEPLKGDDSPADHFYNWIDTIEKQFRS